MSASACSPTTPKAAPSRWPWRANPRYRWRQRPTSPAARAKILVVDDNSGVLEEATEQLTRLGYDVVSASSGAEALAVLERGERVDLLFTDVVMPGDLAGRDLADKATELRPGLKVLFASGYFEGALVSKGALETDVQFIAKPYRMKALAQKVEEVLGS